MVVEAGDPFVACARVVAKAAYEWATREQRTDDISCIVVFLDDQNGAAVAAAPSPNVRRASRA